MSLRFSPKRRLTWISLLILLVLAALFPLFATSPYHHHIMIMGFYLSICALSWRLIFTVGEFSLAHMAFVGIGSYTSALLVMKLGLSFWAALPIAGLVPALIAAAIGYPALKLRGAYFAIMTLVLGQAISLIFMNWSSLTRGAVGLVNIPPPSPLALPGLPRVDFATSLVPFYYLGLVLLIITIIIVRWIDTSRLGGMIRAIAQSDLLAESLGIDTARVKVAVFAIGCFIAGIAGAFYAHRMTFISPESFNVWGSMYIAIYAIVGGIGSVAGPVIGSFVMSVIWEIFRFLRDFQPITNAAILILIMFFLPGGLVSLIYMVVRKRPGSLTPNNIGERVRSRLTALVCWRLPSLNNRQRGVR